MPFFCCNIYLYYISLKVLYSAVTVGFCPLSSQERDRPWRLPADYPNSLLLVNRGSLLQPGPCATKRDYIPIIKYIMAVLIMYMEWPSLDGFHSLSCNSLYIRIPSLFQTGYILV